MDAFSGILFHMYAGDADALFFPGFSYFHIPFGTDGRLVLGDLVSFGKIRVEIILAGEQIMLTDL